MDDAIFNPISIVDATTLTGSYVAAVTGLVDAREIEIQNESDEEVYVSFDGSNLHYPLHANNSKVFNLAEADYQFSGSVYLKHAGVVPTEGDVYISSHGV